MKQWLAPILLCALLILLLRQPSARPAPAGAARVRLTVSAAISLKESLESLRTIYQQQHAGVEVMLNLWASGLLQRQIEEGAPVDIFVAASRTEMDELRQKGLLAAGTERDLLSNRLVLICPASDCRITGFASLTSPAVRRIAIANPESVPAGRYARQTLQHLHLWQTIQSKIVLAGDVRQALADVETGNAAAGLVYSTEAQLSPRVRRVADAPADSHQPIVYPVAIIRRSANAAAAKRFVDFMFGPQARAAFERQGFVMANP